jgi:hypothetical protein
MRRNLVNNKQTEQGNPRIYLGEAEVSDIFPDPCVSLDVHFPDDESVPLILCDFEDQAEALAYVRALISDLQAAREQLKAYFAYYDEGSACTDAHN